jgi:hypothetical protein
LPLLTGFDWTSANCGGLFAWQFATHAARTVLQQKWSRKSEQLFKWKLWA